MKFSKYVGAFLVVSLFMHHTAFAQSVAFTTAEIGAEEILYSSPGIREKITQSIGTPEVREMFVKHGVTEIEFRERLAGMTDSELQKLSNSSSPQVGGEVIVISVGVLLLILLIVLLLRPVR